MTDGPDIRLDLRGLTCPQPVLRARKAMRRLPPGAVLALECTDPLAAVDIPHFAREAGYELLDAGRAGDLLLFRLRNPL